MASISPKRDCFLNFDSLKMLFFSLPGEFSTTTAGIRQEMGVYIYASRGSSKVCIFQIVIRSCLSHSLLAVFHCAFVKSMPPSQKTGKWLYIARIKIWITGSLEISLKLWVVLMLSVLMDFKGLLDIICTAKLFLDWTELVL